MSCLRKEPSYDTLNKGKSSNTKGCYFFGGGHMQSMLFNSHQYTFCPCSSVVGRYCTAVRKCRNIFSCTLRSHIVSLVSVNYTNPAVQPATALTVHSLAQDWQDLTWIMKWRPRHQNFHLFSCGKLHTLLLFFCCLLLKSTKNLKAF